MVDPLFGCRLFGTSLVYPLPLPLTVSTVTLASSCSTWVASWLYRVYPGNLVHHSLKINLQLILSDYCSSFAKWECLGYAQQATLPRAPYKSASYMSSHACYLDNGLNKTDLFIIQSDRILSFDCMFDTYIPSATPMCITTILPCHLLPPTSIVGRWQWFFTKTQNWWSRSPSKTLMTLSWMKSCVSIPENTPSTNRKWLLDLMCMSTGTKAPPGFKVEYSLARIIRYQS